MLLSDTIRLFLDSIGHRNEYEYYIKRLHSRQSGPEAANFAILCPDSQSCQQTATELNAALYFLLQLKLNPALLLSGPQALTNYNYLEQADKGKELYYVLRPPRTFSSIKKMMIKKQKNFWQGNSHKARQLQRCPLVIWPECNLLSALQHSSQLSQHLHLIRLRGNICDNNERPYLYYYCASIESKLAAVRAQDRALVLLAQTILGQTNFQRISLSTPFHLLKEIFTVKGAGYYVSPHQQHLVSTGYAQD